MCLVKKKLNIAKIKKITKATTKVIAVLNYPRETYITNITQQSRIKHLNLQITVFKNGSVTTNQKEYRNQTNLNLQNQRKKQLNLLDHQLVNTANDYCLYHRGSPIALSAVRKFASQYHISIHL